jgi:hypothetical protein
LELKESFAKIVLFLAFQIDHKLAWQIIKKPWRILVILAEILNTSKSTNKLGGITTTTPNHLNTSYQIEMALEQCKKRWEEDSTIPTHPTQSLGASGART